MAEIEAGNHVCKRQMLDRQNLAIGWPMSHVKDAGTGTGDLGYSRA
jgi:hypothetical protein